jgi:hypothetical protein
LSGRGAAAWENVEEHRMIALAMGWLGTLGSVYAYVLLSRGRWHAASLRYSALNGLAGILGGCASAVYGAWPSVAANIVWTGIAVQSGLATLRERRARVAPVVALPDPEPPTPAQDVLLAA